MPHHSPALSTPASVPSSPSALVSPRTPFGFSSREKAREPVFSRSYSFHSGSSFKASGRRWSTDSAARPSLTPSPSLTSLSPSICSEFSGDRLVFANEALTPLTLGRGRSSFFRSASASTSGGRFGEFEAIREAESRDGDADWDDGDSPTFARGESSTFARGESSTFARGESSTFARGESSTFARGESSTFARGESSTFARGVADWDGGNRPTFARGDSPSLARGVTATLERRTSGSSGILAVELSSASPRQSDGGGSGLGTAEVPAETPAEMPAAGAELAEAMAESGTMGPTALLTDRQLYRSDAGRRGDDGVDGSGIGGGGGAVSARQRFPDFAEEGLPRGAPSASVLSTGAHSGLLTGSLTGTLAGLLSGLPTASALPTFSVFPRYSDSAAHLRKPPGIPEHLPSSACVTSARATSALATSARAQVPEMLRAKGSARVLLNPGAVTLPLFHVREGFNASFSAHPGGFSASSASSARLKRRVAAPAFAPFLKTASAPPAASSAKQIAASSVTGTKKSVRDSKPVVADSLLSTDPILSTAKPPARKLPAFSPSASATRSAASAPSASPAHLRSPDLVAPPSLPARPAFRMPTLAPSPARKAPQFAPPTERNAPPALSPILPQERRSADPPAGRPRRLPAVHALANGALALLVPLAGSGPQVLQMLGGPAAWVRRLVVSMGLAVALYSVSVVATVTAAFYWAWWPIWCAVAKNLAMRVKYRHAGLWKARLLDLQVVRVGRQTRWRVLIGDHSHTTLEMDVLPPYKSVRLRRGDPVELLVLSDCPSLSRFRAAREIFFPQRSLWLVGDKQACIERSVFEEMRRKVALKAAVEDGEDSEGEDWDGLYSLLTDENEQLLQNYSYNEASSMQSEMGGGGGKGVGGSLGGGFAGVGGMEGAAGGMSGGGASLGGLTSFPEDLGVKGGQELMPHQGLLDYSAMDSAGSGGFRDPVLASSFGGGGSVGAVADGLAASTSGLMDGGGSGPLSLLLGDSQDSELLERLRET
ncbi:hypothetical protein CLOM_g17425 [Closterium sp. NIES-68]|nr:hypothetical protein CLOM_g17425 [Closterium sp. NIES-68]